MDGSSVIKVEHLGLGEILRTRKLTVPPNQREYSWSEKEVTTMFQDFAGAIHDGGQDYFLGTIVVVRKGENLFEIVDGQQRLATTTILLAAIRDYLMAHDPGIAENINREFLVSTSASMRELEPKLRLNLVDNEFFSGLLASRQLDANQKASKASHERLEDALAAAEAHVKAIVSTLPVTSHGDALVRWVNFIRYQAQVVLLINSSEANAYRMFETLNDRGLKTTQADLVKNYLFGRAGERLGEAQERWTGMRAALEQLDDEAVPTVTFLRHSLMLLRGYFRENTLHDNIQLEAKTPAQVINLLTKLEGFAATYAALFNPESERWNGCSSTMREALRAMNVFGIAGMRPLMLATATRFSKKNDMPVAFKKFISWQVRYLIAGQTLTGGYIEVPLAAVAKKVYEGGIQNQKELSKEMIGNVPSDEQFERSFAVATVSKVPLARYYLRSLELASAGAKEPAFIPNDDGRAVTLEHVLPQKPLSNWPAFSQAEAKADVKRLGNLALLQAKQNSDAKSSGFQQKKAVLKACPFALTSEIGLLDEWDHPAIEARQAKMAKLALKAWPL